MDNYNTLKTKYKFIATFSKKLREHIEICGVCSDCKKPNTGRAWCNKCDPGRFLKEGKSSGNREIDNIIYEAQRKTRHYDDNLEWIPYDRFQDPKLIGEGGVAKIYSATWLNGDNRIKRNGPIIVALKKLKNSNNMREVFINEIKIHYDCNLHITKFYGITKDPETEEYLMVLEYATFGNLREYLKKYSSNLEWKGKLEILYNIIDNLKSIHDKNYIHRDLHSGNILQFYQGWWYNTKITDLGLAQLIYNSKSSNCGVLPYIAPEVLNGKEYTFGSDVYSFGIIMTDVSTGKPPYGGVPHDGKLALAICNGLRPRVAKGTPKCYINLVNQCLDANPEERPSAKEVLNIIKNWQFQNDLRRSASYHEKPGSQLKKLISYFKEPAVHNREIFKEFVDADKIISQESSSFETTFHPEAIYTSRFMSFNNLSKPMNSTIQIEDPEVSDSQLIELHISRKFH